MIRGHINDRLISESYDRGSGHVTGGKERTSYKQQYKDEGGCPHS
jgi:hypothetical protein